MIILIYALLLLLTLVIGNNLYRSLLNPISIWASIWAIVGIFSNLAFFEYYKPSGYVNLVIIVGIIVYSTYCIFHGLNNRRLAFISVNKQEFDLNIQFNVFLIINLISIAIEFPFFIKAVRIYLNYGFNMAHLRGVLTDASEGIISGGLISIIRDSGIKNVYTLSCIYAAVLMGSGKKNKYKRWIVLFAILETMEYCITNAARLYLVNFVFFIVFAVIFFNGKRFISAFMRNKGLVALIGVLIVFGLIIQNSRASDMSILKTIYMYYCSGPTYLSRLLEDSSTAIRINSDFYWGTVTLGFISNIFYYLQIALTGINNSTVKLIASTITIKQYFVGQSTYLNAMCTCFYAFLADWGTIGAIIGPMISAIITCRYFRKMKFRKNLGSMAICIYVFYLMFRTVFKWDLLYIDFTVLLLLNYFICPIPGQRFVIFSVNWSEYDVSKD